MVDVAGSASTPSRASNTRSLRAPQTGSCARSASTACSTAGAVRPGLRWGRRERSCNPAGPAAAWRRSHL